MQSDTPEGFAELEERAQREHEFESVAEIVERVLHDAHSSKGNSEQQNRKPENL